MTSNSNERHALIIATGAYRDPKLKRLRAPTADAERLATLLRDPAIGDFEVEIAIDEEEHQLRRRIAAFFAKGRPDDLLLLHFSCHGVKDDRGELYLAAANTEMEMLSATAISSSWLNEQISRTRSTRTVVLLDCCFSGSFPFGVRHRAGENLSMNDHFEGRGRAVITASSSMEYAFEGNELSGEGQPSVFTDAVAQALETGEADADHDQKISVAELYDYIFKRVRAVTPSQTPNMLSGIQGSLFIAKSRAPVKPAKLDESLTDAIESPLAAVREGAVEELERLLKASDAAISLAAEQALEGMLGDDSRKVSERARAALGRGPDDEQGGGDETEGTGEAPQEPVETTSPRTEREPDPDTSHPLERHVFDDVLYRRLAAWPGEGRIEPEEEGEEPSALRKGWTAYKETFGLDAKKGLLIVETGRIEYRGKKAKLEITSLKRASLERFRLLGLPGADWVVVETGGGEIEAFLHNDKTAVWVAGTGSDDVLAAINRAFPAPVA